MSVPDAERIVVTITGDDGVVLGALGRELVERRLVACAQIDGPIESTYRWKGAIECAAEWRLTLKTRSERLEALASVVRERHTYDVPEIVAVAVVGGDPEYLAWIDANVRGGVL